MDIYVEQLILERTDSSKEDPIEKDITRILKLIWDNMEKD